MECISCEEYDGEDSTEVETVIQEKCPKSKRPCGHHCNHTWTHDKCCWCGWVVPEDQE